MVGYVERAMSSYATLQGCRTELMTKSTNTVDDAVVAPLIEQASVQIDNEIGQISRKPVPWFMEEYATHAFPVEVGGRVATFGDRYLVSAVTVKNADTPTRTTIDAADYTLLPEDGPPYTGILLDQDVYWLSPTDEGLYDDPDLLHPWKYSRSGWARTGVQIAGRWCYHGEYARAWRATGKTVSGGITNSATTLNLSAAAGTAIDVGCVLRVTTGTDVEYMLVEGPVAATAAATALTVRRGYAGSTAVAHDAATAIYRFYPEPTVVKATQMLVASLYAARQNPSGDRLVVEGLGAVQIPSGMPVKVTTLLEPYKRGLYGR
jgi:hypothetical protein